MKALKKYYYSISYEFKNGIVKDTIELVDAVKRNTNSVFFQNSKLNLTNKSTSSDNTQVNSNNIDNSNFTKLNSDNKVNNNFDTNATNNVVDTTSINTNTVSSTPVDNIVSNQLEKTIANEQSFSNSSVLTDKTVELVNKTVELAKATADNLSSSLAENFVNTTIDITNNYLRALSAGFTIASNNISFLGNKTMIFVDNNLYHPLWNTILYYTPNPMDYHFFVHKSQLKSDDTITSTTNNPAISNNNTNRKLENSDTNVNTYENSSITSLPNSEFKVSNSILENIDGSSLGVSGNILYYIKAIVAIFSLFIGVLFVAFIALFIVAFLVPILLRVLNLVLKMILKLVKTLFKVFRYLLRLFY